jgi:hypothetical protein
MADRDPQLPERRNRPSYDEDFAAWIEHQAAALRDGRFDELDIEELVDEVESLGKRDFKKLRSALRVIIQHMLKWDYQPERRDVSWRKSINEHRERVWGELATSPSFRPRIDEAIAQAFPMARHKAWDQTGVFVLEHQPQVCPYGWDEIMYRPHELPADKVPRDLNSPDQGSVDFDD